jgi:hypothetical protein
MEKYKILFVYASRSRRDKFFKGLSNILNLLKDKKNYAILIKLDKDDPVMTDMTVMMQLTSIMAAYPDKLFIRYGFSGSKINAINRDVNEFRDQHGFDILVNFSDDMEFTVEGFDEIIRDKFKTHFPDTDGNLHFNDGYTKDKLCTMSIIGRKYYDRYNYIYHPDYKSLWCDNEYTIVAKRENKMVYFPEIIFKHNHPANVGGQIDELLMHTESFSDEDCATFTQRQKLNFP